MNNARRKEIAALIERLNAAHFEIQSVKDEFETQRDTEQQSYDNMPESFQESERGQKSQAWIEGLETVVDSLDSADGEIDSAFSAINDLE